MKTEFTGKAKDPKHIANKLRKSDLPGAAETDTLGEIKKPRKSK